MTTPNQTVRGPKQAHWVPAVYLRQFRTDDSADGDPRVWVWDKVQKAIRTAPSRVTELCTKNRLYSPIRDNGSWDLSMEEELERFEAIAGRVWPAMLESDEVLVDPTIREFLAYFLAYLHLRNYSLYELTHKAVKLSRELYGFDQQEPCATNFAKKSFVDGIRSSAKRIATNLSARTWAVLKFDHKVLATNDRPVIFFSDKGLPRTPMPAAERVFFPLSPAHLLYLDATVTSSRTRLVQGKDGLPEIVNAMLSQQTIRTLIGSKPIHTLPGLSAIPAPQLSMRGQNSMHRD